MLPLHTLRDGRCTCGKAECGSPGKHPLSDLVPHGLKQASSDPSVIERWWSIVPDANVGLATGASCGMDVLDVDGDVGEASLASLVAEVGPPPATMETRTGGGGRHLWFVASGLRNKQKLADKLDLRADGGYVVAAPSLHRSGNHYEWTHWCAPAPAAWLHAALAAAERRKAAARPAPAPAVPAPRTLDREHVLRRASAYLARVEPAISGAGGHDQAWKAALNLVRGFELDTADAYNLLATEYNPRCDPPWSERELRHKVESAANDARVELGYLLRRPAPTPVRATTSAPAQQPRTAEPAREQPQEAEGTAFGLPATPELARWLGFHAKRRSCNLDWIEIEVPEEFWPNFRDGAKAAEDGFSSVPRPIPEAQAKRILRWMMKPTQEEAPARRKKRRASALDREEAEAVLGHRIAELVQRPILTRSLFDLTLEAVEGDGRATIGRLSGADLASYKTVRDRAVEHRLLLPTNSAETRFAWDVLLLPALREAQRTEPNCEEVVSLACAAQIRDLLQTEERFKGETIEDLRRGRVIVQGDEIFIASKDLIAKVRTRLKDDKPTREDMYDAARSLGVREKRVVLAADQSRPRVWAFPWPLPETES